MGNEDGPEARAQASRTGSAHTVPPGAGRGSSALTLLIVLVLATVTAAVTLHRLGDSAVCGANEAVEAVFLQQMVEQGALLFPLENDHDPMYKPPLFHWTATALDRVAGADTVTPFNLRLPSALYAVGGVVLTVAFTAGALGTESAWIAGLVLASSYQYLSQGRIGRVDMTLALFESLSLFSFLWWLDASGRGARTWHYVLAFAVGLAVLAKGPVGALLPLAAIGVFLLWERRWAAVRALCARGPVMLALVLSVWWYIACLIGQRYGFLSRQISSENVGRFFGTLGSMAPWYYAGPLLLNSVPWSLVAPIAVYGAFRRRRPFASNGIEGERTANATRLFAIFWVSTVVFFSVAAYKRRAYLLPLWPPTAFLLAWWLTPWLARDPRRRRYFAGIAAALIVFYFFYLPARERRECVGNSFEAPAAAIARLVPPDAPLYAFDFEGEMAPLLFYLRRTVPAFTGPLASAPEGYYIIPAAAWSRHQNEADAVTVALQTGTGNSALVVLRRSAP